MMKLIKSVSLVLLLLVLSAVVMAQRDQVKVGDTVEGELSSGTEAYDFEGEAGSWVIITLNADAFDPLLIVEDSDGNEIARDDDSGGGSNSLLLLAVAKNDTYTIKATSYGGSDEGSFVLKLENADLMDIKVGEKVDDSFDEDSARYFRFEGQGGDTYNIAVSTDPDLSLDTRLTLKDASGSDVTTDDDNGPGLDPYLRRFTLPEDGSYIIQLTSVSGDPISGDVSVSIEKTEPLVLSSDPTKVTLDEDMGLEVMTFTVEKPGVYRLAVDSSGGTGDFRSDINTSFSVDVRQNDTTIGYLSVTGVNGSLDVDVAEAGTLTVNLSAYLYSESVDFEVTMESAE